MATTADDATLARLLSRVALQDQAALRKLYQAAAGRLLAVANKLLGDRGVAEYVVQDTFVTLWTRAAQCPTLRASPMAWLTAITRHRAIDQLRRRRPETPLQWQDAEGQERQHDTAGASGSPLDQSLARQAESALGICLGRIETEPRSALLLAYSEGLTHDQLAARLQRPLGTIKAWIRRSLQRLKDCLGEPA